MPKLVSCGVIVTDGRVLLLGHAARSPRWDIPKGIAGPGEDHATAAVRELDEETGLFVSPAELRPLGVHAYLPGKNLALFIWTPASLPNPGTLVCRSMVRLPGGGTLPELDRFGLFGWDEALAKVGKHLARVLGGLRDRIERDRPTPPAPAPRRS